LLVFYLLFCFARMVWAGPFDLGLYGALNNWFVARRARATSIATLAQMSGLVALPIIAQLAMRDGDWRDGWVAIGATVLAVGFLPRRWPLRYVMSLAAVLLGTGTVGLIGVNSAEVAYLFAGLFGLGIGGVMTLLPMAWADYFGRESYGAIRGVALSLQVLAQAVGPLLSGALRDWTGNYVDSLMVFAILAALAAIAALAARRPVS